MSDLWYPPSVSRELQDQTAQYAAEIRAMAQRDATLDTWTKRLKQKDPYLELIKARDDAQCPGMKPGHYHVLRHNPGAPPTLLPISGPDGEFVEPTSALLNLLDEGDLQNERAMEARRAKDEAAEAARRRDDERDTEDRQAEIHERYLAATRAQVSMSTDAPWTQNVSSVARRDGHARRKARR